MKKKMSYLLLILINLFSCKTEIPPQFTEAALNDTFLSLNGESVLFKEILKFHKGKTIVLDIWASWCGDCIKGMPKLKELQENHSDDVVYMFLSLDRSQEAWKRAIKKYNVKGEHYYILSGRKGALGSFLNIDWIPRYMVIDKTGQIKLFKAVRADDKRIIENL